MLYFFLFYLGSVASEVMYVAGLAYAYRRGDISLVYPLVRAIPVLLVAAVTFAFSICWAMTHVQVAVHDGEAVLSLCGNTWIHGAE